MVEENPWAEQTLYFADLTNPPLRDVLKLHSLKETAVRKLAGHEVRIDGPVKRRSRVRAGLRGTQGDLAGGDVAEQEVGSVALGRQALIVSSRQINVAVVLRDRQLG